MAPSPVDKQPASHKSPHNWLVRLAIDLATLCDMWTSGYHLAVFSEDVAVAHHFVTPHPAPTFPTCVSGTGYTSEKLSKMVGYSASHPFNSWCLAIELW